MEEDKRIEEIRAANLKDKGKGGKAAAAPPKKGDKEKPALDETKPKDILVPKSRWLIKKGQSVKFLVGFFCKEVAIKPQSMSFEIMTYPPKEFKLNFEKLKEAQRNFDEILLEKDSKILNLTEKIEEGYFNENTETKFGQLLYDNKILKEKIFQN